MDEKKFNVLYEPWIPVMYLDGSQDELSVMEVFEKAPQIYMLAGETSAQNTAILRFLEAILFTVVTKMDDGGSEIEFEEPSEAIERWKEIWLAKTLPMNAIRMYLEEREELFWLIHPVKPFWQAEFAQKGSAYTTAKLFGDLAQSGNKIRLFQNRNFEGKESCSYSEAARWVMYLNGYDDTSSKVKREDSPSIGPGWLGKIGQVYARGKNLFDTFMLNLCLLDENGQLWEENIPFWDAEHEGIDRWEISAPDNPAAMLTLRSRWLYLNRQDDRVIGYSVLGGEFFNDYNCPAEVYTFWNPILEEVKEENEDKQSTKTSKTKKKKEYRITGFQPKLLSPSRQMWRDFQRLIDFEAALKGEVRLPGVVNWLKTLYTSNRSLFDDCIIDFMSCAVHYGDKNSAVVDSSEDTLTLNLGMLSQKGAVQASCVIDEIQTLEKMAFHTGCLFRDVMLASGGDEKKMPKIMIDRGMEVFFQRVNVPFKNWLQTIDPQHSEKDYRKEWHKTVQRIVYQICSEQEANAPDSALFGRTATITEPGGKETTQLFSLIQAIGSYRGWLYCRYPDLRPVKDEKKTQEQGKEQNSKQDFTEEGKDEH